MKRIIVSAIAILALCGGLMAQGKYFTKTGSIMFYSKAPLENIEAKNKSVTCVLDTKTGNIQFAVMLKGFEFEKALMQEHFNENYVESHKYPRSEFKGQLVNNSEVDYSKDGSKAVKVKGSLTLHGVTREVETDGTVEVKGGKVIAGATFSLNLDDYNVEIPKLVKDNISKDVKIVVDCSMEAFKN